MAIAIIESLVHVAVISLPYISQKFIATGLVLHCFMVPILKVTVSSCDIS